MLANMAKTTAGPRGGRRGEMKPKARKKSLLTLAGEAAQRGLLLQKLKECGWNLTRTAEALEMAGPADVNRSIKLLGLTEEYEAAKERGDAKAGRPAKN